MTSTEEPPLKLRRTEERAAVSTPSFIHDVGHHIAKLQKELLSVPRDTSAAILLYHSEVEGSTLSTLTADGALSSGAVRLIAFDVKELYAANVVEVQRLASIAPKDIDDDSHATADSSEARNGDNDATTEDSPTKDGAADAAAHQTSPLVTTSCGAPLIMVEDLVAIPRMVLVFVGGVLQDNSAATPTQAVAPQRKLSKQVTSGMAVQVTSLIQPVYTFTHMLRSLHNDAVAAHAVDSSAASFSIMWMSAAWCPPCLRILSALPPMIPQMPKSVKSMVKADMDLTQPIFDAFGVSIIPTFVILDNKKLIDGCKSTTSALSDNDEDAAKEVLVHAKVDSLQNSQQGIVMTFIEKHCATLSFGLSNDDDF